MLIVVVGVVDADAVNANDVKRCVSDKSKLSNAPLVVAICVDNASCGSMCDKIAREFSLLSPPGKFAR